MVIQFIKFTTLIGVLKSIKVLTISLDIRSNISNKRFVASKYYSLQTLQYKSAALNS